MATVGQNYLSLADLYSQREGGAVTANIIEMLSETNPILQDMITLECNDGTSHITTSRSGYSAGTWRRLYQGVMPTKGSTAQVRDTTGFLERWSEVDAKLVDLAGDGGAQFLLNEASGQLDAMSNDMADSLFYATTNVNPERFTGLAPRFNSLSAENKSQIVDAGGIGTDNTSIWFVVWGENTVHALYPKGTMAGLQRNNYGEETKNFPDGSVMRVYRERYCWDIGLTVRDYRYVARVCNIDVADMMAGTVPLDKLMVKAYYRLKQRKVSGGVLVIYCNTAVKAALHEIAADKANVNLYITNFEGEEIVSFLGTPIHEVDALVNAEARVV